MFVEILSAALKPVTRLGARCVCFSISKIHKSSVVIGQNMYEEDLNEQTLDLFYISVVKTCQETPFLKQKYLNTVIVLFFLFCG